MRLRHQVATSAIALATMLAGASSAHANSAVLWACHGPAGQALGASPFVADGSGDGGTSSFGVGCSTAAPSLSDGGLRAAFSRVDPVGGSVASWRLDVPVDLSLQSVRLTRRTLGFGGTPVPGGGQSYFTESSAGVLEQASVEDASNVPLDGVLTSAASGTYVRVGVRCTKPASARCAAPTSTPLGVEFGALALGVSDTTIPQGAVGGVTDPAAGTLHLALRATDTGTGLMRAQASLDGGVVADVNLGGASCAELSPLDSTVDLPAGADCPQSVTDTPLDVDTTSVNDGSHQLKVVVRDAAGNEVVLVDRPITVANTPPATQSSAVLTIGSGATGTGSDGGSGSGSGSGGGSSSGPACLKPALTMALAQKPIRVRKGRSVIKRNKRYRYRGRLTCEVSGKRQGAPAGAVVEHFNKVGKRTITKNGITTLKNGRLSILLATASTRNLIFRYTSADGTQATAKIGVTIVKKKKKKK